MVATIFVRRIEPRYRSSPPHVSGRVRSIDSCSVRHDQCPASARTCASLTSEVALSWAPCWRSYDDGRRLEVRGEGGDVLEFVLSPASARFVSAGSAQGPRLELLGDRS